MPKMTRKDVMVYYYVVMKNGGIVKETSKYTVIDGIYKNRNVYVGNKGAVRIGRTITDSISITDTFNFEIMFDMVEKHRKR